MSNKPYTPQWTGPRRVEGKKRGAERGRGRPGGPCRAKARKEAQEGSPQPAEDRLRGRLHGQGYRNWIRKGQSHRGDGFLPHWCSIAAPRTPGLRESPSPVSLPW